MEGNIYPQNIDDLFDEATNLIARLEPSPKHYPYAEIHKPQFNQEIAQGISMILKLTLASLGECRVETPFSKLRPVIDADGNFKWCCNHETEHCGGG